MSRLNYDLLQPICPLCPLQKYSDNIDLSKILFSNLNQGTLWILHDQSLCTNAEKVAKEIATILAV